MNLSLVSKQLRNIIANEPGNKNSRIIPVFEVSGNSALTFFQNLRDHFLNKKTKKKLQSYRIMRFNDVDQFVNDCEFLWELELIVGNVQLDGIAVLDLSTTSRRHDYNYTKCFLYILPIIFCQI
jgi:hypothetical protein